MEISCPYGEWKDIPDHSCVNDLQYVIRKKTEKYNGLVAAIKDRWKIPARLLVVVVLSLGAVPKATLKSVIFSLYILSLFLGLIRLNMMKQRVFSVNS